MKNFIARQGDVLIFSVKDPEIGKEIPKEKGKTILAYGEVTGHSHALHGAHTYLYEHAKKAGEKIIRVEKETELLHQEHSKIKIPAGTFIVRIQKEYSPEALRDVRD